MNRKLRRRIFKIENAKEFNAITLDVFKYQSVNNKIYKEFITALDIIPDSRTAGRNTLSSDLFF